jgi:ATP-dependent DNA helicase RecG
MAESQNIEYKQSWHDDYLKWVCGFANAFGGIIYIGKNDSGQIVHLENYQSLMESIPNQVTIFKGKIGGQVEVVK